MTSLEIFNIQRLVIRMVESMSFNALLRPEIPNISTYIVFHQRICTYLFWEKCYWLGQLTETCVSPNILWPTLKYID
jgi:hypothetical protein